ncbi:MAG: Gldg family protein [Deltaproteobacteria bacterium]|nr:Gldg family protein [Deltaproteobacteria bacterium]
MNRTIRAIIAVIFVGVIMFCAISIAHNFGKSIRFDITDRKLYTLSEGTKAILGKLRQPIKMKLYYTKTAVMKAPDQIRVYNNYYFFVEALLKEYIRASEGMLELEIVDPRPYSDEETEALRYGIRKFSITEEENFFFGLTVQTQYGTVKTIPFFAPDRQNFLEYDISYLIDTVTARQKKRIGILSSLPVMGDETSGYMAQMMAMQGQKPRPVWAVIQQLRDQYEVNKIETTADEIKDVDILLVIQPKNFSEKTLFAIDQFVIRGGRAIVLVDPFCVVDQPTPMEMQMAPKIPQKGSDLNRLLKKWGVEMPSKTFVGDRSLVLEASMGPDAKPEKIMGYLMLTRECMNPESAISANLNQVRILIAGALNPTSQDPKDKEHHIRLTPLIQTTGIGNVFKNDTMEMTMQYNPGSLIKKFIDGKKPVVMGYQLRGRFKSNFPKGIDVTVDEKPDNQQPAPGADGTKKKPATRHITGLKKSSAECVVVVFSDVDFISDIIAYRQTFAGLSVAGDNVALLMNTIEDMTGSNDLIAMRSRGSFQRPFLVVDKIEQEAAKRTAQEEEKINAEIAGFQQELQKIGSSINEGDNKLLEKTILEKKKTIEVNIHEAQRKLRNVKMKQRKSIEQLGDKLRNLNTWSAPVVILVIAIVLGIRRSVRRRHYISHASDS